MRDNKSFYLSILRLSLPTAFQALMSLMVVLADNVMMARYDTAGFSLAAVSAANSMTAFVLAALGGLAGGAVVLIAQYWGRQEHQSIRLVWSCAFATCLAGGLLFALAALLFPSFLIGLVIDPGEPEARRLAADYLPMVALSWLPFALSAATIAALKGIEVVRVTLYTTLCSLISNIALNYVLIYGKLGLPEMGVKGAALATLLARLIEMSIALYYLLRVQQILPVKARDLTRHRAWVWHDYARFGLPVALTDAQWALVGMVKMMIIGQLGRLMINAAAITDMLLNLGTLFTFALAGGAAVLIGKAAGEGDIAKLRDYSRRIQRMFLLIGIGMAALVYLLRRPFIGLYGTDAETAGLAALMVALCTPTLVGTSYHASCFVGINRGAGDSRFVLIVDILCGWLIVLPSAALAAFVLHLPLHWVYFATRIDQSFKWIIAMLRLRGDRWIHQVTREAEAP